MGIDNSDCIKPSSSLPVTITLTPASKPINRLTVYNLKSIAHCIFLFKIVFSEKISLQTTTTAKIDAIME